jgi:hypothetical protein
MPHRALLLRKAQQNIPFLPKIYQTRQHLARSAGDEMRIELGMPVKQVLRFPSESSATHWF